jgi:phospholipid-translocating ATPase
VIDGIYQSVMAFYVPYLLIMAGRPITFNGLSIDDRYRFGAYVAHPAVLTINAYIMINSYRWDWLMLLIIALSDIFIFFWTGVYTSFTSSGTFYMAAAHVYGEATFWACFCIVPVMCLFPRFAIKALQKVYWPYDVDLIREQVTLGMFDHLKDDDKNDDNKSNDSKSQKSSRSSKKAKHTHYASVDEDLRPIYPPSTVTRTTTHNQHSQNNSSDTTHAPFNRFSLEVPHRLSVERARPSYDRMRASMDRTRASFEASSDFTSAARLSRIESSASAAGGLNASRIRSRLRGLSLSKSANN